MKTKEFINALNDEAIASAISAAERRTSGEIRVFVSESQVNDVVAEAQKQFVRLGMTKTDKRNGVLIYFAPQSQAFAVIGDEGIHKRCGDSLWCEVTSNMKALLKDGKYTEAIVSAIQRLGEVLAKEFPWQSG